MENFTVALGNTLINSLWEGVILAIFTALIIVFTRKYSATVRYNLLVANMLLFVSIILITFCYELGSNTLSHTLKQLAVPLTQGINTSTQQSTTGSDVFQTIQFYIGSHTQTIVLIWFLIVLMRCLQLASGLHELYHLRRNNLFAVDEVWAKRVATLANCLGINQMVGIAESSLTKVPMVIGHLKPLILVPVGLMATLTPAEIEAILVHELAHIRRRDYLVNLLQNLLEIFFFFNPAVLWLSSAIRAERENCCDDIALAQTSSKVDYIRALVSCQEYQLEAPAYAMAFPGKRSQLMDRVKRMASGNNQSLNFREKSILFIALLTTGLLTAAFTNAKEIAHLAVETKVAFSQAVTVTTTTEQTTTSSKPVVHQAKEKVYSTSLVPKGVKELPETTLSKHKRMALADSIKQSKMVSLKPLSANQQTLAPLNNKLGAYKPYKTEYKPYTTQYDNKKSDIGAAVTDDLIKDKLINADDKNTSFKLSDSELIVNGVRQPEEVFKRYKDKFVPPQTEGKKGTWTLYSNYVTTTTTSNVLIVWNQNNHHNVWVI